MQDKGRMFGYRRALTSLNQHTAPIYDVDDLEHIPNIGKGIRDKVKELLSEG
jgi:DNA polymerase/3'-5' exonuclease PolX